MSWVPRTSAVTAIRPVSSYRFDCPLMQINTSNSILEFLNNKKMAIVVEGKGTGTVIGFYPKNGCRPEA